ncbi:unnamed protein product [Cercopithifilaria johnstoni]|uniref:Uncharacterized protein n=1 Tax=Cercopithifilaria johnstoni TaxID=2874296 RepID=A0A8J2M1L4_9BILA|nr:unnamed protein product [Cercopithifilaria johnstoni]
MSPMPSTPSSSSTFYRNLWRLTERNKKQKNESLTNSRSNSDEAISDHSNMPQQQQQQQQQQQLQQSVEVSYGGAEDLSPPPKGFCFHLCKY